MSVLDDFDHEVQLEPPQQTIRAEAGGTARTARELTYGESRVLIHAVTAVSKMQIDAAAVITATIARLRAADVAAKGWLLKREHTETGTWRADQDTYVRHHRDGTDGENADDVVLDRRPRLKEWMYWALLAVLVVADFMFFLYLWRDVEEATSWYSVQTLESAVYALITPVSLQVFAYGLGRVVATWLRKGRTISPANRALLVMLAVTGTIAVLTIVFGVRQRIAMHDAVEGAVSVNHFLFYSLFMILPLGLGIAEVLKHDEVVALDAVRSAANSAGSEHVDAVVEAGSRYYNAWVSAHDDTAQLRDELRLQLQEPFYAAADLLAQERAHHGHDGSYANMLWSSTQGAHAGSGWVDVELPSGALDPVLDGPTPRVNLDRVNRLDKALEAHRPPTASDWMNSIEAVLYRSEDEEIDEQVAADDDLNWDLRLRNGFDVVLGEPDSKVDNP